MPPHDDDDEPGIRKLGDAVPGRWLKIVGTVVACEGEPLVAPLTGRKCACFDAAVWSYELEPLEHGYQAFEEPMRTAKLLLRSLRGTPFVIEDGTGRGVVDPRGAYVRLAHDHEQGGPHDEVRQVRLADPRFLDGIARSDRMKYSEGALEIGEVVVVSGFVQKPDASPDGALYRAAADPRVRIAGSPGLPADITDLRDEVERAGGRALDRMREMTPGARVRQHVSGRMIIVPDE